MRVNVTGIEGIADLASDLRLIPRTMRHRAGAVVARNIERGSIETKRIADRAAGPHGSNYSKRISSEMTGALSGEYGPSAPIGSDYTGVSGAAGAMRDLEKSAAKTAPRFQRDISRMVDGLFWP